MIGTFPAAELGHYALVLALALALVQSTVPLVGLRAADPRLAGVASGAANGGFLCVALSFACLTFAHVTSDFSVANVWENNHSQIPLLYKVSAVWGNHEGSMLLWVLMLSGFAALVANFGRNLPLALHTRVLAVQGWIASAFILFLLLTSNPFARIDPAPLEGQDLNPVLQDIGLAIHPPLLYLGYVGFSIAFAFAVAALIGGTIDSAWARWVRPWTLLAWLFLTSGIAMGSYWAYYELGWGGWWFWDPVENASFMPWLAGTALLHSAVVMEKRGALKIWTILLAILTFSLSLLGTFLVRSGVLTSVHSFASDPTRGIFILMILVIFIGGALALFAWRAPLLTQGGIFAPISREGALVFNNLFLVAATATVLVGTLYPLALEAVTGTKISVGPPFFNNTFVPLMIPLLLAMPFGPLLAWKRADLPGVAQRLGVAMVASAGAVLLAIAMSGGSIGAPLGLGLATWMITGALVDLGERIQLFRAPIGTSLSRLAGLQRSAIGTVVAHAGMGVTVLGIVAATAYPTERIVALKPGETLDISGYTLLFQGVSPSTGPNFREETGRFLVSEGGRRVGELTPSKRNYVARAMATTEAAIRTTWFSQLYLSLGDHNDEGAISVRAQFKPLVTLIWIGAVVMSLGGALSLSDRRLRVGAPRRAKAREPAPA